MIFGKCVSSCWNNTHSRIFNFYKLCSNKKKNVRAKNLLPVHTAKNNVGAYCNTPVQNEKMPVQPQQNEKSIESTDKARLVRTKEARKRYLASLCEAYAQKLFSKLMNELSGTLTMKNHKGTWYLVFSCGGENGMIQAKGKTLAHALINLASKSHCFTSKTTAL